MEGLKKKSVLITGGARRIGRHIALAMARAGADVAFTYLSSERQAHQTLADLAGHGRRTLALRCDVSDQDSVQATVKEVLYEFGRLDVLVNNAALFESVDFEQITPAQWDRMFASNARGPFLVSQAAAKALRRRRGRIINIGSLGGLRPWAEHAHYCASKAAVTMLTEVMAKALAPRVSVNCVAPGMIQMGESKQTGFYRRVALRTPMKRAGTAADVVDAVMFFATASHFITGQTLLVDGGLSLG
jgi:NAD(P)-dependent dehydrogenase (short-subunit alcohol dehydrogenase family)